MLAPSLEYSLFAAVLGGQLDVTEIDRKSLSHLGQIIHKSIADLAKSGENWDVKSVSMMATEGLGADKLRVNEYLGNVGKHEVPAVNKVYALLKERNALLNIANEIQTQLTTGNLDVSKLQTHITTAGPGKVDLTSVAEDLAVGEPEPPNGPPIKSLPRLSEFTNGIHGVYIVAALPNIGKSTLCAQIATDISRSIPAIYYDYENTRRVLLYRLVQNWGLDGARKIGANWYIRESLRTLNRDLAKIKPPAVIIVDSFQKIGGRSGDDRREGLEAWLRRFEELKLEGYTVLLISELNRASYTGVPKLDAFKESGEIEYTADTAVVLTERDQNNVMTWIVKNRHYPHKGPATLMERTRPFWYKELDVELGE